MVLIPDSGLAYVCLTWADHHTMGTCNKGCSLPQGGGSRGRGWGQQGSTAFKVYLQPTVSLRYAHLSNPPPYEIHHVGTKRAQRMSLGEEGSILYLTTHELFLYTIYWKHLLWDYCLFLQSQSCIFWWIEISIWWIEISSEYRKNNLLVLLLKKSPIWL